jgi:hypothetical protein
MTSRHESRKEFKNFDSEVQKCLDMVLAEKYIHTPRNKELWFLLEDLMLQVNHQNPKPKVMGCLLTGEPHSGKTTAVRQFKKAYLENVAGSKDQDVIITRIPSRARLKGVMVMLACQLKIPDIPSNPDSPRHSCPTYILVDKVAKKLWSDNTKLLIIDEFQKLFEISNESRIEILEGFNDLLNESHVPIVLVGVAGVDKILDLEHYEDRGNLRGTFCSRFAEFKLQPWADPDELDFIKLLKTLHEDCNIFKDDDANIPFYKDFDTRKKILEMTDGLTGKIVLLIKWTARYIIRNGLSEEITMPLLELSFSEIKARGWME